MLKKVVGNGKSVILQVLNGAGIPYTLQINKIFFNC